VKGAFTGAANARAGQASPRPTAARCSSTRSATCRWPPRPSSCGCSSREGDLPGRRRPRAAGRRPHRRGDPPRPRGHGRARQRSAPTCTSASRCCRCTCPALRDRGEDILFELAEAILAKREPGARCRPASTTAAKDALLAAYSWPGNVRELHHVIERALLLAAEPDAAARTTCNLGSRRKSQPQMRPAVIPLRGPGQPARSARVSPPATSERRRPATSSTTATDLRTALESLERTADQPRAHPGPGQPHRGRRPARPQPHHARREAAQVRLIDTRPSSRRVTRVGPNDNPRARTRAVDQHSPLRSPPPAHARTHQPPRNGLNSAESMLWRCRSRRKFVRSMLAMRAAAEIEPSTRSIKRKRYSRSKSRAA
jgi:hypothetical protein